MKPLPEGAPTAHRTMKFCDHSITIRLGSTVRTLTHTASHRGNESTDAIGSMESSVDLSRSASSREKPSA